MAQVAVDFEHAPAPAPAPWSATERRGSVLRAFVRRNKVGTLGFIILGMIVLLALFGPLLAPGDNPTDVSKIWAPPTWDHPLGNDYRGKDVLYQVIRGGQTILIVATLAALISTGIAVTMGALAALIGGRFDAVTLVITDVVLTIPTVILLSVLAAYVTLDNIILLAVIIAVVGWPTLLRAVRSQVLSLKEREYVEAARMLDLGMARILFREVLPNMASYIVINFVLAMTGAIYGQIVLYFLGLVPLRGDNWGLMVNEAYTKGALFYRDSIWYVLSPIIMISLLQLSLVMISRSLEDVFNPRLREN